MQIKPYKLVFSLLSLLMTAELFAADKMWRFRAREHFEVHEISQNGTSVNFRGLSNTINYWYEEAFDYALGFSFGPVIGGAEREQTGLSSELGDDIKLLSVGAEYKKWVNKDIPLFIRAGIGYSQLKTDGSVDASGFSYYYGGGYEWVINGVGIAIEVAYRESNLSESVKVKSFTPSIGVHLYPWF